MTVNKIGIALVLLERVARFEGTIVGFAELEENGHIDHFYVHHDWLRKGVGQALYDALEADALKLGLSQLYTESSSLGMPFFVKLGFEIIELQEPIVCGAPARRYLLRKMLDKRYQSAF